MKPRNIIKYRLLTAILSAVIIIAGFVGVSLNNGFNLGIDFQSGVSMQVSIRSTPSPTNAEIQSSLESVGSVTIQRISAAGSKRYIIKTQINADSNNQETVQRIESLLNEAFNNQVEVLEVSFIGPRFSQRIAQQSIVLTLVALTIILIYIWIRFRLRFSISAISALIHDVLMTVAFLGITRIEISTTSIAALLTIIGYSLNDTIVIFDRIRENGELQKDLPFPTMINLSIQQSLSRTIITSLTTLLAVIAIFVFSSGAIKDFALCMMFGVVVGTYSSIFIASPILILWDKRDQKKHQERIKQSIQPVTPVTQSDTETTKAVPQPRSAPTISINAEKIKQELLAKKQFIAHKKAKHKKKR